MYRSRGGRIIGQLQRTKRTLRSLTVNQGKKMDSAASAKGIPVFIATHRLNVTEIEKPVADYKTFNEFFARRLKPGVRKCEAEGDDRVAVSPADCRLTVWDSIEESKQVWVKGRNFTLANVLGAADSDGSLCAQLTGGSFLIARLAPQDYHRWHWPVSGKPGRRFPIDGDYNTVNPIAVRKNVDVYTDNKRTICPIRTADFGLVVLVAIGATMVGSINFVKCKCGKEGGCSDGACVENEPVRRFEEHGWFAFGGSTVIALFQPGAIAFDSDLKRNSAAGLETLIKVGRRVGVATRGGNGGGGEKQGAEPK
jgi:phosphatidylserine decarboxylase